VSGDPPHGRGDAPHVTVQALEGLPSHLGVDVEGLELRARPERPPVPFQKGLEGLEGLEGLGFRV
jgi:hypothetical protein